MSFTNIESKQINEANLIQKDSPEAVATSHELPEHPVAVIEPSKGWVALNLRDIWHYRDLLYILTERDIKVRYKQTILGAAWAIVQPLFTMLVFSLFFGKLAGMPSDGIPYPLFVYAGILPWIFFSNALTKSGNSLVSNSNLITKVYFPRMIIPIATVTAGLLDFLIAFVLLVVLMLYYSVAFSANLLMLPVLILLTSLLAVGVGMYTSALNVKYRDVSQILPFLVQLWMFATPIIYPASIVTADWRWVLSINPLAGIIEGYRAAFFGKPFDWFALLISAIITFSILIYAAYTFRKMERSFADVI
jgi:lipopolysaccharide transport system permease protein